MSEEILINSTPTESRVAMVDNGVLQEVWLERLSLRKCLGNVYKGTVCRVLPGMQAAFIDIGLERTAFLHASEIYRADANTHKQDAGDNEPAGRNLGLAPVPLINTLVSERAEVVVQVIKDPIGTKGAGLTTNLSIPSRFLVLLPDSDNIEISARIGDEEERERLKELVQELRCEADHFGYIVRTNAEDVNEFALSADMTYLRKVWQTIQEKMTEAGSGECVYEDLSMPLKALRDLMHSEIESVRIDSGEAYEKVLDFVQRFIPEWSQRIQHYKSERPVFDLYGIEDEIDQALRRHAPLKSGGHLVIDQTEAMTTIDVNTGAYVGHLTQEETIFKTNLEAATTIARQLRLRNLGGIIIIDFIDMLEEEHKRQVMKTLEKALEKDHARTSVSELSPLGLVEMTRQRTTESLGQMLSQPCPVCTGRGSIKNAETVSREVFREITRSGTQFESSKLLVLASPLVVNHVLDEQSTAVSELEELIGRSIQFQSEDHYTQEQFDVVLL